MKESFLYLISCFIVFIAFLGGSYYISKNNSITYQNTIVFILTLLSLSKCIEYYEKHVFKLSQKH